MLTRVQLGAGLGSRNRKGGCHETNKFLKSNGFVVCGSGLRGHGVRGGLATVARAQS
ncbi:MAG: hypothetical protein ACYSYL_15180 [Planctomycetota bacterium]